MTTRGAACSERERVGLGALEERGEVRCGAIAQVAFATGRREPPDSASQRMQKRADRRTRLRRRRLVKRAWFVQADLETQPGAYVSSARTWTSKRACW